MTLEELKAEIVKRKLAAFDLIRTSRSIDPKFTGHKSKEERALMTIDDAAKGIEKLVSAWEKANPDRED